MTACHKCEFDGLGIALKNIKDKIKPIENESVLYAFDVLTEFLTEKCSGCKRVCQDDIRIKKTPHALTELIPGEQHIGDAFETVTSLSEENEDRLRIAMATLFGLSPIQLLLVQHLIRGGRPAHFHRDTLWPVRDRVEKYKGSERAQTGMMIDSILKKAPIIAPLIARIFDPHATIGDDEDAKNPPSQSSAMKNRSNLNRSKRQTSMVKLIK